MIILIGVDGDEESLALKVLGNVSVRFDVLIIIGALVGNEQQVVGLDLTTENLLCGLWKSK